MSDSKHTSPRLANRFLGWYCRQELAEEIRGDLEQAWLEDVNQKGRLRAALIYWFEVVLFIRSHTIRRKDPYRAASTIMISNYSKVAFRSMRRDKVQSVITLASLSVGIAASILILLYARHEMTADSFHEASEDVYRVHRIENRTRGGERLSAGVSMPLGPTMLEEMPEVYSTTRMRPGVVQIETDGILADESVVFVDPGFFEVFSFKPVPGSEPAPLNRHDGVALSQTTALRLFGPREGLGETLQLRIAGEARPFIVEAILEDAPSNSSISFEILLPIQNWPSYEAQRDQWVNFNVASFVRFHPGVARERVQGQLDRLVDMRFAEAIEMFQSSGWWQQGDNAFQLLLMPIEEVHFASDVRSMVASTGNLSGLRILMAIGFVILLLACINFMTLSTGRSTRRAAEVGIRKTFGANRGQLARQFWGEAIMMSGLSLLAGLALVLILLPRFNQMAETGIALAMIDSTVILQVLILTLAAGLIAGGYPAMVLSRFTPSGVLKGQKVKRVGRWFSRSMVVVQFSVSIGMILVTLVMLQQIDWMKTANLGFAGEEIIVVSLQANQQDAGLTLQRLKGSLDNESSIMDVSASSFGMANGGMRQVITQGDNQLIVQTSRVDPSYLDVMDMSLVAGRNLSEDLVTDIEQAVLVNETFAAQLDFEDPIGQLLPGYEEDGVRIVGVVEDFHFLSMREAISPMMLHMSPSFGDFNFALIRLRTDRLSQSMGMIQNAWQASAPDQPFVAEFMDSRFDQLYRNEERWGRMMQFAAMMAVVLACLGLFGLAMLTVRGRMKEIGIRKVLGASSPGILALLSKEFMVLIAVSFFLAAPVTWWILQRWLDGFAYHMQMGPGVFLTTASLVAAVAFLTVAGQSWKAATINPARILKIEG